MQARDQTIDHVVVSKQHLTRKTRKNTCFHRDHKLIYNFSGSFVSAVPGDALPDLVVYPTKIEREQNVCSRSSVVSLRFRAAYQKIMMISFDAMTTKTNATG